MPANNRVGTTYNLGPDGTYDILLFSHTQGFPEGRIKLSFGSTPRRITGVQKVAQVFAKILMTPKGSDPIRADQGTDFSDYVMSANLGTDPSQTFARIASAVRDAETQTKLILNGGADLDSQLRTATLFDYDIKDDIVTLYMKVVTAAGAQAAVAIPFPQTTLTLNV